MTDEVQNQSAAPANPMDSGVSQQSAQAAPEVAAGSQAPVDPTGGAAPQGAGVSPQPVAAAAPVDAAQTKPEEAAARAALDDALNDPAVEIAALDTVAGIEHAHSMVSSWLARAEAGLHISIDELRATKARLAAYCS